MTTKLTDLIARAPWRVAVTYRHTWPHEYVLSIKDGQRELQDAIYARFLDGEGVSCRFFRVSNRYLFIGDYKYWFNNKWDGFDPDEDNVVNRARLYRDRRDFVIQPGDTGKPGDYPTNPAHPIEQSRTQPEDLTMPQESTLLSFIAQHHYTVLEDIATDALCFILSRSSSAREALSELMANAGHERVPIAEVQRQVTDDYGARPDLTCLDEDGKLVALIESKFWATLTSNQPVTYWEGLPANRPAVLLFLAPDNRVDQGTLWAELEGKLRDTGHELGDANRRPGLISARAKSDQRRLMLTTWQLLLDRMAKKAGEEDDTQTCFEIAELQGLAASAIEGERPTRDENLKQLIADAVRRLEQLKWANTHRLWWGQSRGSYFGHFLRLAGAMAWLGIEYRALRQMPERPLWLIFSEYSGDDTSVTLEEVRGRLEGRLHTGMAWRSGEAYLPIELPPGADSEKTLNAIVDQLERIAKLIDPEGPTYR